MRHYEPENAQLAIDRGRLRELSLDLDALRKFLEAQPFIFAAYTEQELARASAALRSGCQLAPAGDLAARVADAVEEIEGNAALQIQGILNGRNASCP